MLKTATCLHTESRINIQVVSLWTVLDLNVLYYKLTIDPHIPCQLPAVAREQMQS